MRAFVCLCVCLFVCVCRQALFSVSVNVCSTSSFLVHKVGWNVSNHSVVPVKLDLKTVTPNEAKKKQSVKMISLYECHIVSCERNGQDI